MDMMADALKRRRGKGMELQILLDGEPVMQGTAEMQKDTEMAPPPAAEAEELGGDMGEPMEAQPAAAPEEGAMEEQKPRSLGERARMMAGKFKK